MKPTDRITLALLCGSLGIASSALADAPALMPVQGFLTDAAGTPRTGQLAITFELFTADSAGTSLHAETQAIDVAAGAFTAYLGGGTQPLDLTIFTNDEVWLEITVGTETLAPRFRLATAPYAAYSQLCGDATTLGGMPPSAYLNTPGTGVTIDGAGRVSVDQGTVEGYARGVSYDTEAELTALLNDNYAYTNGAGLTLAANQFAVSGVTSAMITDATVALADLAANSVNSAKIADGTIASADLAAGAIGTTELANNGVTTGKIVDATITGADISGAADLTVDTVAAAGAITASSFVLSPSRTDTVYIDPASCIRDALVGSMLWQELNTTNPPANAFGPGFALSIPINTSVSHEFYCPINVVRRGGNLTITGAALAFYDNNVNCVVGAEIRTKTWGVSNAGTVAGSVYSGTGPADFATTLAAPSNRVFPAFTVTVAQTEIVWVNAILATGATGNGLNCRFHGVRLEYTTDRP